MEILLLGMNNPVDNNKHRIDFDICLQSCYNSISVFHKAATLI